MTLRDQKRREYAAGFKALEPYHELLRPFAVLGERVEGRDPCFHCGVRGDVPCRHRGAS